MVTTCLNEPTDDALIESARQGDSGCFGILCERHRARIWRIAASVADGADADDIAQDAVIRAYEALSRYRADAPFGAWLSRITVNAAHDHRRSAWKRRVRSLADVREGAGPSLDAEELAMGRHTQRQIRRAVADLPERERVPIWLHYFDGFTVAEIARLSGEPEATLRSRVRSGLRRLGKSLSGWDGTSEVRDGGGLREADRCRI